MNRAGETTAGLAATPTPVSFYAIAPQAEPPIHKT
jgi:hypothetical protein